MGNWHIEKAIRYLAEETKCLTAAVEAQTAMQRKGLALVSASILTDTNHDGCRTEAWEDIIAFRADSAPAQDEQEVDDE